MHAIFYVLARSLPATATYLLRMTEGAFLFLHFHRMDALIKSYDVRVDSRKSIYNDTIFNL